MVKNQRGIEQIAGLVLIGAIVLGCGLVLRPFMSALLWAAILCFATWPLHELLLRGRHGRPGLAAGIMTVLLALVLILPFFIVGLTFTDSVRAGMAWIESCQETGLPPPPAWVARIPLIGQRVSGYWQQMIVDAGPAVDWLRPRLQTAGT